MKARFLLLMILALCLLTGFARAEMSNTVPAAGDTIGGFTVTAVEDYDILGAKVVYMTHDKTEGSVIWIANDDTERSFAIGFRTHYDNDKGVPHVFEHAALSGSDSYPDPQLFFNMMNNTCQTFLNATTFVDRTIYPCASISDEQLLKFEDVYLSGVFEPLVVSDEHAMQREAYRYQLDSEDADLQLTGTVYSEMIGNYYGNETLYELMRLLFPGSWYSTCTGGQPGVIETMTQQDLIDFHDTYYQPSNALAIFYGDLNIEDFLSVLGGYYDRYEKTEVSAADPNYQPFTGYTEVSADVSASEDEDAETDLYYAIPIRGISDDDRCLLSNFMAGALNNDASAMHTGMMSRFPGASFSVQLRTDGAEPMLLFSLEDADGVTASEFSAAVQEDLAAVLEEGIHYDYLRSVIKNMKRTNALARENQQIGVDTSKAIFLAFAVNGEADRYFRNMDALKDAEAWLESGTLEKVISEQLIGPEDSRAITINKVPGLTEQHEQEAAQRLTDRKASMTEEEIAQTVAATAEYTEWAESLSEISLINEVNVLTVDDLPEEVRSSEVTVSDMDGIRYITSEVENGELVCARLWFRADWVPTDQLQRYSEAAYLLGRVRTGSHTLDEVSNLMTEYGIAFTAQVLKDGADSAAYTPALMAGIYCMKEDLPAAIALVEEILTDSQFDEYDVIRYDASSLAHTIKTTYPMVLPQYLLRGIASALTSEEGLYSYYVGDIPFYSYLETVGGMDDAAMDIETAAWKELIGGLYNREGLNVTIVSDAEGIADAKARMAELTASMPYSTRAAEDYSGNMEKLPSRLGVKISGSANYHIKQVALSETDYTYSPELDILNSLVYDQILLPTMRYKNGVYSPMDGIDQNDAYVLAYRDPSMTKTYDEVIPAISSQVAQMTIDDTALNNLIVSGYTELARPVGPITAAQDAVNAVLQNTNAQQEKLSKMYTYKNLTADDLRACAGLYDTLSESGAIVTAAPASVIDANADMFDLIIDWYVK